MRIIGGSARSIRLKTVEGEDTRPTADRIKETLFNILGDEVSGAIVLDLFAGSGGLGLEAVSRGAQKAVFVDHSGKAVSCIRDNIEATGFGDKCEVMRMDFRSALKSMAGKYKFGLVFLDPPYGKGFAAQAMSIMASSPVCGADTLFVVEESLEFDPEELTREGYELIRDKRYKTNRHLFMRLTE